MNAQIYDEASEWLIELQTEEPSASVRERFATWLDTSPEHVRAYLELISVWEDASGIDRKRSLDLDQLMAAAKSERNLFPLDLSAGHGHRSASSHGPWAPSRDAHRSRRWMALAASVTVLAIGAATAWYWNTHLRGVHSTGIAEQRTLVLNDGTTVELNAGTRIRERFTDSERGIDLLEGQALFRVARNPARPFVVRSDMALVRAVGTEFDVHRRVTGTTVTVLEGRVAVLPIHHGSEPSALEVRYDGSARAEGSSQTNASPASGEILLDAGERVKLDKEQVAAIPEPADAGGATAWTQQRLVFESAQLRDAAEDFNRFNTRKLIVDVEGLEDFKVSGTFQALDPQSLDRFVRFLREQPGLSVVRDGESIRISRKTGSPAYD